MDEDILRFFLMHLLILLLIKICVCCSNLCITDTCCFRNGTISKETVHKLCKLLKVSLKRSCGELRGEFWLACSATPICRVQLHGGNQGNPFFHMVASSLGSKRSPKTWEKFLLLIAQSSFLPLTTMQLRS